MQVHRQNIAYGDRGIQTTMRRMVALADQGVSDPDVIALAHSIVRGLPERNSEVEASVILQYVRDHMRYTQDPWDRSGGKELLKHPRILAGEINKYGKFVGDCDDATILMLSLLGAVGIPSEPVVIQRNGDESYSHVLLRLQTQNGYRTVDPIVRNTGLGWFPPGATKIGVLNNGFLSPIPASEVQG